MEKAQIELWVLEAQQGSKYAFTQLCRYFHPSLLRFSYKLSSNEQVSHEAVQNCWLSIIKSIHRINDPRAFKSWLFQSVRWQTLDLLKKNKRIDQKIVSEDPDTFRDIEQYDKIKTENNNLLEHINTLADIDKQAIHLFYLEQMSLQEISIILAVPTGTIKSRLNRARNTLKQKLSTE